MARGKTVTARARPVLMVEREGQPVLRYALTGRGARVGAHVRNDLSLPIPDLPDFLCEVVSAPRGGYIAIACPGETIVANGKRTTRHNLRDGDRLALGAIRLRFQGGEAPPRRGAPGFTGRVTLSKDRARVSVAEGQLIYEEAGTTRKVTVGVQGLRVGKDPENDLVLEEASVSGYHAVIFPRGDRYFIRDLESTNGTLVNNLKVVEAELPLDAELQFGRVCVTFKPKVSEVTVEPSTDRVFEGIVSGANAMRSVFSLIERVAAHTAPVCVLGETGTGKELVARALHTRSAHASGPFVALNLGAIPEHLLEDELFGHERGAFTGADRTRAGAFEQAQKGTLFLDEVGELPLAMQPKLLRVLETAQVRRLGGQDPIPLDLRIVCATHRDLPDMVAQDQFREDLFHRLYVIPLFLPPLRERQGDVELLATHFLEEVDVSGRPRRLDVEATRKLLAYPWPGNVRELRNVLVRAALLCEQNPISADYIIFTSPTLQSRVAEDRAYMPDLRLEEIECRAIREALERVDGNRSHAAQLLGISRSTLIRKIKELQLDSPRTR